MQVGDLIKGHGTTVIGVIIEIDPLDAYGEEAALVYWIVDCFECWCHSSTLEVVNESR